ncbi:hypothetical protein PDE_09325 [Penicillium oxalicum 114-2]|uniref:Uncharacterized protein n=1 Tax=Penicillium oxalicum (strain 114-2 / CGMCC 5302) TaxID=933388 RepID=S7ZZW3_PENO1|nr:hypothetical protein PDE_09325 [Penicillium oxalicum 114-2]
MTGLMVRTVGRADPEVHLSRRNRAGTGNAFGEPPAASLSNSEFRTTILWELHAILVPPVHNQHSLPSA